MPPTMEKLTTLMTKQGIADLYQQSLGSQKTRINHLLLGQPQTINNPNVKWPIPSVHDVERDFTSWYGGVCALGKGIDPSVSPPGVTEMVKYIATQFEQVKDAIAA